LKELSNYLLKQQRHMLHCINCNWGDEQIQSARDSSDKNMSLRASVS